MVRLSFFKSEFSRNVLTLMMGATIAQAIPIAISPLLTRIYTPDDFGVLALFMAIAGVLSSIVSGRYELAIIIPEKDEDAINILALGFLITCIMTIIFLALVLVFKDSLPFLSGSKSIGTWLYFVPIVVFFTGLFNLLTYFNVRKENYKEIKNATIMKSIILASVQVIVGFIKQGASGLIVGDALSRVFANTRLLKCILSDGKLISKISKKRIITLAKRYKKFVIFNLPSTLADVLTQQLPFLILPKLFSLSVSGYFSLAQKIIALPGGVIAKSISQVYFQEISENNKVNKKNLPLLKRTMKNLFFIALPIAAFIVLFSSEIFTIVFGEGWEISGEISKYLAIVFLLSFIVSTLSVTLPAYEKLEYLAIWQFAYLISSLCLYSLCFLWKVELEGFLFYFVIHEYVMYLAYLGLIVMIVARSDNLIKEG